MSKLLSAHVTRPRKWVKALIKLYATTLNNWQAVLTVVKNGHSLKRAVCSRKPG